MHHVSHIARRHFGLAALGSIAALTLPGCAPMASKAPATPLHILSGGAAKGLVDRLGGAFEGERNARIEATFGAVGAMRDQLLAGTPCDVLILTQAVITELGTSGRALGQTATPLGQVKTGIALMKGHPPVNIRTPEELRTLLASAPAIYFPDPKKATSGIHFMKVLTALGITDASKYRTYPDGAVAMAAMAAAGDPMAVGCTQMTEIITTPGVELIGFLPPPYELSTTYVAAVSASAKNPELARALIAHLSAPRSSEDRKKAGFL